MGYKVEGESSEQDEEDGVAKIMNAQVELDLAVYPTIRGTLSFAQREEKFNLASSLLLREGPINVSAELHLLVSIIIIIILSLPLLLSPFVL